MNTQQQEFSEIEGGYKITKMYKNDVLEQKRIDAINRMGKLWILHPENRVARIVPATRVLDSVGVK